MDRVPFVPTNRERYWRCPLLLVLLFVCSSPVARAGLITESEPNDSIAGAQNVDGFFTLSPMGSPEPNIGDKTSNTSETIPHVTIQGTGDGTFDYYSFTISSMTQLAIFDIDFGDESGNNPTDVDTLITLFDGNGAFLEDNDDADFSTWGAGGSTSILDSYLERATWASPGTFVIRVGQSSVSGDPLAVGVGYTLQISIRNHSLVTAVPEPNLVVMLGIGAIASVVYGWKRRRFDSSPSPR